ncbi:MAG: PCRF domain-containing protein, partial [Clostridia bacterium]|nr:PCRF domain-containing protein [Clostridia bacterium]
MTLDDIKEKLSNVKKSLDVIQAIFPIEKLKKDKEELEQQQNTPDFFSDMQKVQTVGKQIASLDKKISKVSSLLLNYEAIEFLANECNETEQDIIDELVNEIPKLEKEAESMRIEALLTGK